MTKKFVCTKRYDYSNITIEVGEEVEMTDNGYAYEFTDGGNDFHHVTKEEDANGISYKTWFKEVDSNE